MYKRIDLGTGSPKDKMRIIEAIQKEFYIYKKRYVIVGQNDYRIISKRMNIITPLIVDLLDELRRDEKFFFSIRQVLGVAQFLIEANPLNDIQEVVDLNIDKPTVIIKNKCLIHKVPYNAPTLQYNIKGIKDYREEMYNIVIEICEKLANKPLELEEIGLLSDSIIKESNYYYIKRPKTTLKQIFKITTENPQQIFKYYDHLLRHKSVTESSTLNAKGRRFRGLKIKNVKNDKND